MKSSRIVRSVFAPAAFGGAELPVFRPREAFQFEGHPHWFVGHMGKGLVKIQKKIKDVDILLEVRDARAPFCSAQIDMTKSMDKVQRLVVLNKSDLITPNVGLAMKSLIEEGGLPCLLTTAKDRKNLVKIKRFALDNIRAKHPRTLGLMLMVIGLPNVGKSTIINGMKQIAFTTARHQGRTSKLMHGVNWSQARANGQPGTTNDVRFFQLSNQPRLYCYDTPGVSLLKRRNDPERNTKLALLKTMPDCFAGEMYLADYLLYRLNKAQVFNYVEELELPGPTDDVRYLMAHICATLGQRKNMQQYWTDPTAGANFFLGEWRRGRLGKICLDHVPDYEEVQRLRALRLQTEPPGPWGPPCYPEAPLGLELDRRPQERPEGFVLRPRRHRDTA